MHAAYLDMLGNNHPFKLFFFMIDYIGVASGSILK